MTSKGDVRAALSLASALKQSSIIVQSEGLVGLFAGLGPRVLYVGPSCGLFFVVYEAVKTHLAVGKKD
jgi:hypothetical protein